MRGSDLIRLKEIHYEIDGAIIIDGLSFSARKNEFVSIIGPSGCGKSTLLRIIAGLIPPTKGEILYEGRRIEKPRKEISFVFQDFALLPWLTNLENVKLGLSNFDVTEAEGDAVAEDLLKKMGLDGFENSYPNVLSGGMKQRVGLARALAMKPSVLLMDEPFSSLDELTANTMRKDILSMLKATDVPVNLVIMVTHNVEEAVELSDRIVVLSNKPTKLRAIKEVKLDRPRKRRGRKFDDIVDEIYADLTG
jgi:NitT/TauT family transport system ATP-binding protein